MTNDIHNFSMANPYDGLESLRFEYTGKPIVQSIQIGNQTITREYRNIFNKPSVRLEARTNGKLKKVIYSNLCYEANEEDGTTSLCEKHSSVEEFEHDDEGNVVQYELEEKDLGKTVFTKYSFFSYDENTGKLTKNFINTSQYKPGDVVIYIRKEEIKDKSYKEAYRKTEGDVTLETKTIGEKDGFTTINNKFFDKEGRPVKKVYIKKNMRSKKIDKKLPRLLEEWTYHENGNYKSHSLLSSEDFYTTKLTEKYDEQGSIVDKTTANFDLKTNKIVYLKTWQRSDVSLLGIRLLTTVDESVEKNGIVTNTRTKDFPLLPTMKSSSNTKAKKTNRTKIPTFDY